MSGLLEPSVKIEIEIQSQEKKGEAQQAVGKTKDAVKKGVDTA